MEEQQTPAASLNRTGIILVRPKYPENIGASARVAFNFGISRLSVVAEDQPDQERMFKMATHKAAHLIENMRLCRTTAEAAAPYHCIIGTTARQGKHRPQDQTPREIMPQVIPLLQKNNLAMMFGPESTGLSNEDLDFCQFASTIPTEDFASLNLAQAVAIHCYELYTVLHANPFAQLPQGELANSFDLEGMYDHIEEALQTITFLKDTNRVYWMRNIRQFLSRIHLKKKEASLIRGVCRKLHWYTKQQQVSSDTASKTSSPAANPQL